MDVLRFRIVSKKVFGLSMDKYIEKDILEKYEFYDYGHALEILHESFFAGMVRSAGLSSSIETILLKIFYRTAAMNLRFRKNLTTSFIPMAGGKYAFPAI